MPNRLQPWLSDFSPLGQQRQIERDKEPAVGSTIRLHVGQQAPEFVVMNIERTGAQIRHWCAVEAIQATQPQQPIVDADQPDEATADRIRPLGQAQRRRADWLLPPFRALQ